MKATELIQIETPYLRTGFKNLHKLASSYKWNGTKGVWTFPKKRKNEVEQILGEPIELPNSKSKEVELQTERKGKGFFIIQSETPDFYKIYTTIGNKKTALIDVPKASVLAVWKIIKKYDEIETPKLAEQLMNYLGITRFNRESGSFDYPKFFGNRKDYFKLLYYPLKVLDALGIIRYRGSKQIRKLQNKFDIQIKLEKKDE